MKLYHARPTMRDVGVAKYNREARENLFATTCHFDLFATTCHFALNVILLL